MVAVNLNNKIDVHVSDPEVVADLFSKVNKITDKIDDSDKIFKHLLGSSLLFGPADDDWRAKRKACAHAFYKDRLSHMLECLKVKIN